MKRILIVLIFGLLFFSCSSFVYYPNGANAPLLTEKDEMQLALGIKGFGGDIRSAYALTNHFGVQANLNLLNIANTELGTEYRNGNYYAEAAAGFFTPVLPFLVIEAYAGGGLGRTFSHNLDNGSMRTTDYGKIYLQQDIGLRTRFVDFGIAVREAFVHAYMTKRDGVDQNVDEMDIFIEPILFLSVGPEKFKINAQAGISDGMLSWINSYAPFIFSLGVESRFSLKK